MPPLPKEASGSTVGRGPRGFLGGWRPVPATLSPRRRGRIVLHRHEQGCSTMWTLGGRALHWIHI